MIKSNCGVRCHCYGGDANYIKRINNKNINNCYYIFVKQLYPDMYYFITTVN